MKPPKIKLALVCTQGGHFEQMTNLTEFYTRYDHFWVTNQNKQTVSQLENERKYFVGQAHFKKPWTYFDQIAPFVRIFAREKPTHFLSTGSGRTTFIPYLLARLMGRKFFHIDTFSRVNGYSKFGTFVLKTGHSVLTQWEDDANPRAVYIGPIFKKVDNFVKNPDADLVFVTVGTREEPFTRLLKAVEDLVKKGHIRGKVVIQAGHTKYHSDCMEIFDFCTPDRIDELIVDSKYVITQESAGIGTKCLKYNTRFVVMPRDYDFGELPAKSDMQEDLHLKLEEMGYTIVVSTALELENAVRVIDEVKSGFVFDNSLAIDTLHRLMEER